MFHIVLSGTGVLIIVGVSFVAGFVLGFAFKGKEE